MIETILTFLGPDGILWGLAAVVFVAFVTYVKNLGAAGQKAKQDRAEKKARDVADEVDNDIGAMTPEQQRERLKSWSRD